MRKTPDNVILFIGSGGFPYSVVLCGNLTIPNYEKHFHCFLFVYKVKLRHSPGRPSRSDFVQAGFISCKWLPVFANYRRQGYDFDARYEDGLASHREKLIMDLLTGRDEEGEVTFPDTQILSTDLKKMAGFGKGGEKSYPGITTSLQMQTYLVIADFHRRTNKRGEEYGMPVSVMLPPEAIWGYEEVTSAYNEKPRESWQRLIDHVMDMYPQADEKTVIRLIGKEPLQ